MTARPSFRPLMLFVGIALSGCTYALDLAPDEKDLSRQPQSVVEEVLRPLQAREASVTSLKAVLDIAIRHGDKRAYHQVVTAVEQPALIRLESIGWGGFTSVVIVSDGRRLAAHAILQNIFAEGTAAPENVARVTGVRVTLAHLVRLLLGLPPLPIRIGQAALYGPDEEHTYLLRDQESSFTQRLRLSDDGLRLLSGELYDRGSLRLRFRFLPANQGLRMLILEDPVKRVGVEVSYRSSTLNLELPRELFRIPQPDQGAQVVNLDSGLAPLLGFP